jgi:hypothetical protein
MFFERTRFAGSLAGHGHKVPVVFDAWIDEYGALKLHFEPFPKTPAAFGLHIHQRPRSAVDLLTLEGTSAAGQRLRSESFHIGHYNHGDTLTYQGDCYDADLELPYRQERDDGRDHRVWRVRQFRTFRRIAHETPLGRVIIAGPRQDRSGQEPNGIIGLLRPAGDASETWWDDSDRFLAHLARVMSFACDTYFRPVMEERKDRGCLTVRVASQGRASAPFMPPFHELDMRPILICACDAFFERHDDIEQLDPAIRWLTAPVVYDESRLIHAMSALETILDRCDLDEVDLFLPPGPFKKIASAVRAALTEAKAPAGMARKVPELNRRALNEKVLALIDRRNIAVHDMPEDWLGQIIRHRNIIVHTGVSSDTGDHEPDTLDHTVWAREIVTRIILERLGFNGGYRSWLHQDEMLHFPECIRMEAWVRGREAAGLPLT